MTSTLSKRKPLFDNLKFIAIFLVVLGHVIENNPYVSSDVLHKIIYIFHIPLFTFISGYFTKFKVKNILRQQFCLYVLLQTVYSLFEIICASPSSFIAYLTIPRWTLWYLLALTVWKLSTVILSKLKQVLPLVFVITFALSLVIGLFNFNGKFLSVSRMVVYYPFFVLGYYLKNKDFTNLKFFNNKTIKFSFLALSITLTTLFFFLFKNTPREALFGCFMYNELENFSILTRLYANTTAVVIVLTLSMIIPNKECLITKPGSKSLAIYILHIAPIILLNKYLQTAEPFYIIASILFSVAIVLFSLTVNNIYSISLKALQKKIKK